MKRTTTGYESGAGDKAIAADLDGDGVPDVISSGNFTHASGVWWHGNDGKGNFETHRRLAYYGAIASRTTMRAGDIDGDGDLDVVAAAQVNRRIDWYENRHGAAPFVVDGISDQVANVDVPYDYTIAATAFDDLDDGNALEYSATLADGSDLPTWLSFNTDTFSGTPPAGDSGELEIAVTAEDSTGASVTNTFTLHVIDASGAPSTQVTHTGDSGAGSLRQVIADADDGATITFAPELAGSTIIFASGTDEEGSPAILIDKSLTLDGDLDRDGTPDITISGNQTYALFNIDDGDASSYLDVVLKGLVLTDARVADKCQWSP